MAPLSVALRRQRLGWYCYEAGMTPYWVGVMQLMPVLILQQAQQVAHRQYCTKLRPDLALDACMERGWAMDFEQLGICHGAAKMKSRSACASAGGAWAPQEHLEATRVAFFLWRVHYAALRQVADVISVLMQMLTFTLLSSMADYGNLRRRMLMLLTFAGFAFVLTHSFGGAADMYWLNTLCLTLSSFLLSFAGVFYNSYLPLLVDAKMCAETGSARGLRMRPEGSPGELAEEHHEAAADWEHASAHISAHGLIAGYISQTGFMIFGGGWLYLTHDAWSTYIGFAVVCALWGMLVACCGLTVLPSQPGKRLSKGDGYVSTSVRRLRGTLRGLRSELTQMRIFLIAWFIHSDGAATVGAAATTFAAKELDMPASVIMAMLLELSVMSGVGAAVSSRLVARGEGQGRRCSPKVMLLISIGMLAVPPMWGIVAMTTWGEFFVSAGIFGLGLGVYNTMNRSIFAGCIPSGREAEFFGLYEVTNRGTAWVGPLIVAYITTTSGEFRWAFASVLCFFAVGGGILALFDGAKATRERLAAEDAAGEPGDAALQLAEIAALGRSEDDHGTDGTDSL